MFTRLFFPLKLVALPLALSVLLPLGACTPQATGNTDNAAEHEDALPPSLVIGTYTGATEDGSQSSEGLYRIGLDKTLSGEGEPELLAAVENPSFIAVDSDSARLYVVSEVEAGQVLAYQWSPQTARLELINQQSTQGAYPCYVALSPDGSHLAVANYGTGNIAVYPLDAATGAVAGTAQQRQHHGAGPNPQRQEAPHAHWVQWSPDGRFVYAVDLGIDQVKGYSVDPQTGELGQGFVAWQAEPGAGPRHMVFHPQKPFVYILNELDNSVTFARYEGDGSFATQASVSTLPDGFTEHSQAAHIAISPDGTRLYASNRGHHSIAVFAVEESGELDVLQWTGTEGEWPRHFTLMADEGLLLVANEHSHNVRTFSVDAEGLLTPNAGGVPLFKPVYVSPLTNF